MDEPLPLTTLSEVERQRALERFRLLQPFLAGQATLRSVARAHGLALRTAHRWVAQYRQAVLSALQNVEDELAASKVLVQQADKIVEVLDAEGHVAPPASIVPYPPTLAYRLPRRAQAGSEHPVGDGPRSGPLGWVPVRGAGDATSSYTAFTVACPARAQREAARGGTRWRTAVATSGTAASSRIAVRKRNPCQSAYCRLHQSSLLNTRSRRRDSLSSACLISSGGCSPAAQSSD